MRTTRRGEFSRGRMVNYSHMLVVALAVTSLVLLVKYRNLTWQLSQTEKDHVIIKKALENDLGKGAQRFKELNMEVDKYVEDKTVLNNMLQNTQHELTNSVNALQDSHNRIEALKLEKQSQVEELNKLREEKAELQTQKNSLQEELTGTYNDLEKMEAMASDGALNLKDAHGKQEKLLSENTRLTQELASSQVLQGENENLRVQLQSALSEAKTATDRVAELEAQIAQNAKQSGVNQNKEKENGKMEKLEKVIVNKTQTLNGKANGDQQNPESKDKGKETEGPVYDMLDEEERNKIEKELNKNDEAGAEGGGERSNTEGNVLGDGEGRALELDAGKDLKDNIQGVAMGPEHKQNTDGPNVQAPNYEVPEGSEGVVAAPMAFGKVDGSGGSFQIDNMRALLSFESEIPTKSY